MLPVYQTMFSELRHHPRFDFHYKNYNGIPKHVNQEWAGKQNYHREKAIIQKLYNLKNETRSGIIQRF